MLNREELKDLSEIQGNENYYVSLYLNVNPITNPKGEYVLHLKNMIREVSENTEKGVYRKIKSDLEKISAYVTSNKREFRKGLALVSSEEQGFRREYNLSVPVKNTLIVDNTPYIKPLLDIVDNNPRHLILLVEKDEARIFVVHLGEIVEYGEIKTADVPGKHKKGGWFALAEPHYQRHIDYHVGLHLKEVIKKLESFLSAEQVDLIFIGGSEEAVTMFKDMLPETVRNRIKGQFAAEMFLKPDEVLKRAEPLLSVYEAEKEKKIVDELITRAMKGNQAVLGIEDVIGAAMEGKIHKLVFVKDYEASGFKCVNCGLLSIQNITSCPYCSSEMESIEYLVELVTQRAVEQGATIEVLAYETTSLKERGNIGAILRF
jgi:peptide chain release factor subunit 1